MTCDKKQRYGIKRGSGRPTIPVSSDHRNGDWLATDLYEGEQYQDVNDGKVFTRNGASITNGDGSPASFVYKALIDQVGTVAPVATTLQDEITGLSFNYVSPGIYTIDKVGAFLEDKVFILTQRVVPGIIMSCKRISDDQLELTSWVYGSNVYSNNLLIKSSLLIEIYS